MAPRDGRAGEVFALQGGRALNTVDAMSERMARFVRLALLTEWWWRGSAVCAADPSPKARTADDPAAVKLPPAPASRVMDETGMLGEEQRLALSGLLQKAHREHGLDACLAIYSFVAPDDIESRAWRLKQAWTKPPLGLVMVYERGSGRVLASLNCEARDLPAMHDVRGILDKAYEVGRSKTDPTEGLVAMVHQLLPPLSAKADMLIADRKLRIDREQWQLFACAVALLAAGVIVAALIRGVGKRIQAAGRSPAFFPTVSVAPRFGAPFGGGTMAELTFGQTPADPRGRGG